MTEVIRASVFQNGKMTVTPFDVIVMVEHVSDLSRKITFIKKTTKFNQDEVIASFMTYWQNDSDTSCKDQWWYWLSQELRTVIPTEVLRLKYIPQSVKISSTTSDQDDDTITIGNVPGTEGNVFVIDYPMNQKIYLSVGDVTGVGTEVPNVIECVPHVYVAVKVNHQELLITTVNGEKSGPIDVTKQAIPFREPLSEEDLFQVIAGNTRDVVRTNVTVVDENGNTDKNTYRQYFLDDFVYFSTMRGTLMFTLEQNPQVKLSFLLMKWIVQNGGNPLLISEKMNETISAAEPEDQTATFLNIVLMHMGHITESTLFAGVRSTGAPISSAALSRKHLGGANPNE